MPQHILPADGPAGVRCGPLSGTRLASDSEAMGYTLRKKESASAGVRRIAREELDAALEKLDGARRDSDELVHELRKHFKKVRSVLRLVRAEIGEEIFARDNGELRALGRRLAPARDASMRASALQNLRKRYTDDFPSSGLGPIARRLESER